MQLLRRQHRRSHGVIATAKNSGTHWLQQMLSLAIAHHHGLPPPRDVHPTSNEYVGKPKGPRPYPHLPYISRSHYTPHRLMASAAVRRLAGLPPTVVLVREWSVTLLRLSILKKAVIAADRLGKLKTTFQVIGLSGLVLPFTDPGLPDWCETPGDVLFAVAVVLVGIAVVLTIVSGVQFFVGVWGQRHTLRRTTRD